MNDNTKNLIKKNILPLVKRKEYDKGLVEIRKLMKNSTSYELQLMEIGILFMGKKYTEVINIGSEYINKMKNSLEKAEIVTSLQLIYSELGDSEKICELGKMKIEIYESIISNSSNSKGKVNLATLNLSGEYLRTGQERKALQLCNDMLKRFKTTKINDESMLPLYSELARVHAKLDHINKTNEFRAKIIVGHLNILANSKYSENYKHNSETGINSLFKTLESSETVSKMLKYLVKEIRMAKKSDIFLTIAKKETMKYPNSIFPMIVEQLEKKYVTKIC